MFFCFFEKEPLLLIFFFVDYLRCSYLKIYFVGEMLLEGQQSTNVWIHECKYGVSLLVEK